MRLRNGMGATHTGGTGNIAYRVTSEGRVILWIRRLQTYRKLPDWVLFYECRRREEQPAG